MLSKIETLTGCQTKKYSDPLVWEKTDIDISNYETVQFVLTTDNYSTGVFQVQITGFNEDGTHSKVLVDRRVKAKNLSYVFTIGVADIAHDNLTKCNIVVSTESKRELSFSVLALYFSPRYTEEKALTNEDWDFEEEEEDVEIADFQFNGSTVTRCTQIGGVIEIPSSYKIIEGKYYKGNDFTVTALGSDILWQARDYTEVIIPDTVIDFPVYGLHSTLDSSCKKIVTGNGFGVGYLLTYPFGHTNNCEIFECGTGLQLINGYIFGHTSPVKTLKFATEIPPTLTGTGWIGTLDYLQQILVPQNAIDNWKNATNWNSLASKIVGF